MPAIYVIFDAASNTYLSQVRFGDRWEENQYVWTPEIKAAHHFPTQEEANFRRREFGLLSPIQIAIDRHLWRRLCVLNVSEAVYANRN